MRPPITTIAPLQDIGYVRTRPHPQLQAYVHSFWQIDGYLAEPRQEYLHPDGSLGLVFNWGDTQCLRGQGNYGQASYTPGASFDRIAEQSLSLSLKGTLSCFGLLLKPGVAYTLFGVPATLIGNEASLSQDYWQQLNRVALQLSEASGFLARVEIVENWLTALLAHRDAQFGATHKAISVLQQAPQNTAIENICSQINLSRRQLERLLKRDLGLSFKQYQNLLRVRCARSAIKSHPQTPLGDVALASGFYDQAHFNRVFSANMGITPGAYRQLTKTRHAKQ